jgi:hypothetical protein
VRFLTVASEVADRFANQGFRYLRSHPALKRRRGDWEEQISFETSRYNTPESATVGVRAMLFSRELARWRRDVESPLADTKQAAMVFTSYLGYLAPYQSARDWYVGRDDVEAVVSEISLEIERYALPFFDEIEADVSRLAEYFVDSPATLVEVLLLRVGRSVAESVLANRLKEYPRQIDELRRLVSSYRAEGELLYWGHLHQLARVIVFHDLEDVLAGTAE